MRQRPYLRGTVRGVEAVEKFEDKCSWMLKDTLNLGHMTSAPQLSPGLRHSIPERLALFLIPIVIVIDYD